MTTTSPAWSAAGVTIRPATPYVPDLGLVVALDRYHSTLSPELIRSLRDWLGWWLDDHGHTPPPADPDRVRLAIDAARAELRQLAAEGTGPEAEHVRAGLAWADRALDTIARAAGEPA